MMELPRFINNRECPRMRIQTILNTVEKFKSFVYGNASLEKLSAGAQNQPPMGA